MASGENPYQSPVVQATLAPQSVVAQAADAGVWRQGRLLVMHKRATLPPRCVKTNQPAERWLTRGLSWHHPALILTVFAGVMVYVLLALLLRKTARIRIGLTETRFARRRLHLAISWGAGLLGFGLIGASIAFSATLRDATPLVAIGGFVLLVGALIYGQLATRMVAPKKIDDHYVWLSGVCSEYLDQLPEWPYR